MTVSTRFRYHRFDPSPTLAFAIAVVATGLWWMLLPDTLVGWDPIQFALGLSHLDMAYHQPHPPGYLGHMAIAKMFAWTGASPASAVIMASKLAGGLSVFATYFLGWRLFNVRTGIAAAVLMAMHPLAIYALGSGETYSLETLAVTILVLAGLYLTRGARLAHIAIFFMLYGLFGGVRQSIPLFFFPFALWRLVEVSRGQPPITWITRFATAGLAGVLGSLIWAVPLAVIGGGPEALIGAFSNQFFELFGKAYSPLMGAGRAAVLSNLDGLWRFGLSALSISSIMGLVLWPIAALGRTGAFDSGRFNSTFGTRAGLFAAWLLPPLVWFVGMYVYKATHLLMWTPILCAAGAGVMMNLPTTAKRLGPLLVGVAALIQIAIFMSPPQTWSNITGERDLPAIEFDSLLVENTTEALGNLAGDTPESLLIVCRDGQYTFRHAMFNLPHTRVLYLIDTDSTGARMSGVEVCEGREFITRCESGAGFWEWADLPQTRTVKLDPQVRRIAWFADENGPFAGALVAVGSSVPAYEIDKPAPAGFLVTDVPDGTVDFSVGPYRFTR